MKRVKWGVIGSGGIANLRTIPGMLKASNAELVAVMDVNYETAQTIREKYNVKSAYNTVEEILNDVNVEAIYIASPVVCHKEQMIQAALAGKHILVEKPMALTVTDCEEIIEICKKHKILASVGFMMRFHAYHQKMRQLIKDGTIGQIISCRAQMAFWYPKTPGTWRQDKKLAGGGALMDGGVHCIDLLQYITDSKAKKVCAMTGNKVFDYDVEDSGSLLFETENGAYCYVEANFNIPHDIAIQKMEIYGTLGSMYAEGTISQIEGGILNVVLSQITNENSIPVDTNVEFGDMYCKEIESFGNSILNGAALEVPIEDALQIQKVIDAAYNSAENLKTIKLQ